MILSAPSSSLGITSIILGVACLPMMCIPIMNVAALILGTLGGLLGLVGFFQAINRGGHGIGFSIGGLGANAVVVAMSLWMMFALAKAVREIDAPVRSLPGGKVVPAP